jgi:asparagine synthase (glutamine-hydrolysing)
MCGISGIFQPDGGAELSSAIRMNSLIRHRGPDSEGYLIVGDDGPIPVAGTDTDPSCMASTLPYAPRKAAGSDRGRAILGHRRLSIIDLTDTGHQPMSDPTGRYWISYNGEIYNYIELRRELEALGHRFVGHSDTEVLLAGFIEWGQGVLGRLRGMFAFVILDLGRDLAFAARDRFGIKPLYLRPVGRGLLLGSEIKQLFGADERPRANGNRLYDFLAFSLQDHTAETMFEGIWQLPAGMSLTFPLADPRLVEFRRWYRVRPVEFSGSLSEAGEEFHRLLASSVSEHLRADVPVGSCLSGGLDSSSIVGLVHENLANQGSTHLQHTFTATSDDPKLDESSWARMVVSATGASSHEVQPRLADLAAQLDRVVWHMDEPFGSTSIFAQWSVFELAHQNQTKVLLDGQGADEQLAGYHNAFGWFLADHLYRLPS